MGRKADKKELKVQEEAVQEIGYDNLPYYNVEDRIVEMVQNDDSWKKYKKVREFVDEYNKRKESNDFNKPVLKAALAKKSAGSVFDEDVSLFSNYIFGKTTFSGKEIEIRSLDDRTNDDSTNYKWKIVYQGHSYRGDTMNSWSTTLNEFIRVFGADFIHSYCERKIPEGYNEWEHFLSKHFKELPAAGVETERRLTGTRLIRHNAAAAIPRNKVPVVVTW